MFWIRLRSSIILVIAALFLLLTGGWVLAAGLFVLSLIAFRELMRAAKAGRQTDEGKEAGKGRFGILEWIGFLGTAVYYTVLLLETEPVYWLGVLGLVFLGMMAAYVVTFPSLQAGQVMTAFFCFFYGPVLFSFIWLTRELPGGIYMVWLIFISSWICDTCAYLSGMALGKHKLTPVLSPKKSIEGAVGGVAGAVLLGIIYSAIFGGYMAEVENPMVACPIACGISAVISQIGDLAASAIKRNHGVKDYGKLIPGHGGILDRFDSMLFTAPAIYFALTFLR